MASGDEEKPRPQDRIDRSKLVNKRAQRAIEQSATRIARGHHQWVHFAVGRICDHCEVIQLKGEFEDETPCSA
jgi:hypothetical protein